MSGYERDGHDWHDDYRHDDKTWRIYESNDDDYVSNKYDYDRHIDGEDAYRFSLVNGQISGLQKYDDGSWRSEGMERNETWRFDGANLLKEELELYGAHTSVYADSNGDGVYRKVSENYDYRAGVINTSPLRLGGGDDHWQGGDRRDHIYGDDGDDLIGGGGDQDMIYGGQGDDNIHGMHGKDTLYGEDGNDTIRGGHGPDQIFGGNGGDWIWGGIGRNTVDAGAGDNARDDIYIPVDSINNTQYGNPGGANFDPLVNLGAEDKIYIHGESITNASLTFGSTSFAGYDGIGIYANGTLEALVTGGFSAEQVQGMTTGGFFA